MAEIKIRQSRNAVELTLTLSWDSALTLYNALRPVMDELAQSDQVASQQADWAEELERRAEQRQADFAEIKKRNLALGRSLERFVRRYVREAVASGDDRPSTAIRHDGIRAAIAFMRDHNGAPLSFGTAQYFIKEYRKLFDARRIKLRDREVWRLYEQGLPNKEIGARLSISPAYLGNLLGKLRKAKKGGKA